MSRQKNKGKRRRVPVRTCIACRQAQPKRSMIRVVASTEDGLVIDPSGKKAGRGAYICHQPECWDKVLALPGLLSKALRAPISEEDRATLLAYWERELNPSLEV